MNNTVTENQKQITLVNPKFEKYRIKLSASDLTDISNPDYFIELSELFSKDKNTSLLNFSSSSSRTFSRVISFSNKLGLIIDKEPTNKSRALLELDSKSGKYGYLATLFDKTTLGMALMEWSGSEKITTNICGRINAFLRERIPNIKDSTRKQYAREISKLISNLYPHHPENKLDFSSTDAQERKDIKQEPHFENKIIDAINRAKVGTKVLRIPTGFMSAQGYDLVARNLENTEIRILLGKDDLRGRKILSDPLNNFGKSINNGIPSYGKISAHKRLYKELVEGSARVKRAKSKMIENLHGKGFFGDRNWAISTSANLSISGLERNIETGYTITNREDVNYYVDKFEGLWEEAEDITAEFIEEIVESWIFQEPVRPYYAYLRSLNEIFGSLASRNIGEKYELASFQKMVAGSTIRSLKDRKAALMISPTGTGKTVMGSYIMAAMKNEFEKVVVLIPNSDLKNKWEEDSLCFGIHPMIITHKKLQVDLQQFRKSKEGNNLHMYIDENTLIVIDEAHKFRTEKTFGNNVITEILSGNFNGKKPGVLLLTATPIGTGFENLRSIYELMNLGEGPERVEDLQDFPSFINVTLPFIMNRFGHEEEDGNVSLSFGKKRKYYATRRQMIAPFDDKNGDIYDIIKELDFRELSENTTLDSFGIGIEPSTVDNMNFVRIGLTQSVGSSKETALERVDNLLSSIKERRYLDPEKTKIGLLKLKNKIKNNRKDELYIKLLKILENAPNKKVIVNVTNVKTREILVEKIKRDTGRKVVQYVGSTNEKKKIRERFAPRANAYKIKRRSEKIDILIASGGLAEGHDLQDAEIIVNYDSWWTPLKLQQRMGRLDRPTDKPREFTVFNLVITNEKYTNLVTMDEKLRERSNALKDIIADGAYELDDLRDSKNLDKEGIVTIEMNQEYGELDELITTSQHIADLSEATNEDINYANNLAPGFCTSLFGDSPGVFTMIRHKKEIYAGYLHEDGMISYAPGDQNYEKLISLIRSKKHDLAKKIPDDHLNSVEILTSSICKMHNLEYEDIIPIFSAAVVTE